MIIQKSKKFENSLESIVLYIAKDSKNRALSFQRRLNKILNNLSNMPYKYRKSYYYSDDNIRDLIYKGYTIPYMVDNEKNQIIILDIFKWTDR